MCLQAPALVGLGIKGGLLMMATREMLAHGSPEQPDPTCCPNCNGAGCVRDGTLGSDGVPPTCLACGGVGTRAAYLEVQDRLRVKED